MVIFVFDVVIARIGSQLCPVKGLERYLLQASITLSDDQAIFGPIVEYWETLIH